MFFVTFILSVYFYSKYLFGRQNNHFLLSANVHAAHHVYIGRPDIGLFSFCLYYRCLLFYYLFINSFYSFFVVVVAYYYTEYILGFRYLFIFIIVLVLFKLFSHIAWGFDRYQCFVMFIYPNASFCFYRTLARAASKIVGGRMLGDG